MKKRKIFIIYPLLLVLFSCSQIPGEIILKKSSSNCISIPDQLPIEMDTTVSYSYSINVDSAQIIRQQNHEKLREIQQKNLDKIRIQRKEVEEMIKTVFLQNKSKSDIISFTIKKIVENSLLTSNTTVIKLNPGEEVAIGCSLSLSEEMVLYNQRFEIVGYRKSNN